MRSWNRSQPSPLIILFSIAIVTATFFLSAHWFPTPPPAYRVDCSIEANAAHGTQGWCYEIDALGNETGRALQRVGE